MPASVRAFQRRYEPRQIAAVISAVLDSPDGLSVTEACRLAAAGALKDDAGTVPAFVGHVGTFRDYVAKERRRRARAEIITTGGGNAAAVLADRMVAIGEREITRLENRAKQRKSTLTPAEVRDVASMLRELVKLSKEAGTAEVPAPSSRRPDAEPAPDHPQGSEDEIAAALPSAPAPLV